jgi:hypothetical protein
MLHYKIFSSIHTNRFLKLFSTSHLNWFNRYLKQSKEAANQPIVDDGKKLDLKFKEGQTITINIGVRS